MLERRRRARHYLMTYLSVFEQASGELLGYLVDLTNEGMLLMTTRVLDVGRRYGCRVELPYPIEGQRALAVQASVVWCRQCGGEDCYDTGFQFDDLPPPGRRVIERLVKEYPLDMTQRESAWTSMAGEERGADWEQLGESIAQEIKLQVHAHYLRENLTGSERVLEVGAGRGRFTGELARRCERVVVADISPVKLALNRRNAESLGYASKIESWVECDVVDLKCFDDQSFDAVVCYGGPLSYVTDRRDRALRELLRVARSGGLLFLSVMSLWGEIHSHFADLRTTNPRLLRDIVESGDIGPESVAVAKAFYHAFRSEEFVAFLEGAGAKIEMLSASDCITSTWEGLLGMWRENGRRWQALLDVELMACQQPGCLDMGSRLIAVARK